jgi:hypothetical protein
MCISPFRADAAYGFIRQAIVPRIASMPFGRRSWRAPRLAGSCPRPKIILAEVDACHPAAIGFDDPTIHPVD